MDDKLAMLKNSCKQYKDFYRDSTIWEGIKISVDLMYEEAREELVHADPSPGFTNTEVMLILKGRCQVLSGLIDTIEQYTTDMRGEVEDG